MSEMDLDSRKYVKLIGHSCPSGQCYDVRNSGRAYNQLFRTVCDGEQEITFVRTEMNSNAISLSELEMPSFEVDKY